MKRKGHIVRCNAGSRDGEPSVDKDGNRKAMTYGFFGIVLGCAIGIPINKFLFEKLVTFQWGDSWYLPMFSIAIIIMVIGLSIFLAVFRPVEQIKKMSIVETINAE